MSERVRRSATAPYHHGDLRAALEQAATAELAAHGIEGFSLRGVAKRAGVSHAAPAHHFRDVNGLLTAVAAAGFRRFLARQHARQAGTAADPEAQLIAAGLAYVEFATAEPALFRLMFASDRPQFDDPALRAAADAAYAHLQQGVAAMPNAAGDDASMAWALVHGLADLLNAGRLKDLVALPEPERAQRLAQIIRRALLR